MERDVAAHTHTPAVTTLVESVTVHASAVISQIEAITAHIVA